MDLIGATFFLFLLFLMGKAFGERGLERYYTLSANPLRGEPLPVTIDDQQYYIVPLDTYLEMQKKLKVLEGEPQQDK